VIAGAISAPSLFLHLVLSRARGPDYLPLAPACTRKKCELGQATAIMESSGGQSTQARAGQAAAAAEGATRQPHQPEMSATSFILHFRESGAMKLMRERRRRPPKPDWQQRIDQLPEIQRRRFWRSVSLVGELSDRLDFHEAVAEVRRRYPASARRPEFLLAARRRWHAITRRCPPDLLASLPAD